MLISIGNKRKSTAHGSERDEVVNLTVFPGKETFRCTLVGVRNI